MSNDTRREAAPAATETVAAQVGEAGRRGGANAALRDIRLLEGKTIRNNAPGKLMRGNLNIEVYCIFNPHSHE